MNSGKIMARKRGKRAEKDGGDTRQEERREVERMHEWNSISFPISQFAISAESKCIGASAARIHQEASSRTNEPTHHYLNR